MKITTDNITDLVFIKDDKLYRVNKYSTYMFGTTYGLYDSLGHTIVPCVKSYNEMVLYLYDEDYEVFNTIENLEFSVKNC